MDELLDLPRLSLNERTMRWARVKTEMDAQGIDCLIIYGHSGKWDSQMANVRYLSQIGGNGEEGILVFPREGEPVFLIWGGESFAEWWKQAQDWISDIRPGRPWHLNLRQVLSEKKFLQGKLGFVGLSSLADREGIIPYTLQRLIQEELPKAEVVDASSMIEMLRMVKRGEELEMTYRAAAIADEAIDVLLSTAKPGVRENELFARVVERIIARGGEPPVMVIMVSGATVTKLGRLPSHRILCRGDIILNEITARFCGYCAHPGQPILLGKMTPAYSELCEVWKESYEAGMAKLTVGTPLQEVAEAFLTPIKSAGFHLAGPSAHGVGLANVEPPHLSPRGVIPADGVVQEGLVLAIQPLILRPDKTQGYMCQDFVLVTAEGPRSLSARAGLNLEVRA